ncbi:DUF4153 domain-containing protein [Sphingomonas piscis]|uniref:DUF4153 domain-containing protein n=1 Tax=Sphingomonas piscis TaxID=2714943 RepID=A0A6G7YS47_9SPHN|nr:DUF4153 domain-containing protein [Sphingomonas piscis]QIK79566.1 DUF4153 domain-containing protein [Sphingomonas piscis]
MSLRQDEREPWPPRPWIMAAVCAVAGLLFNWLTKVHSIEPSPGREAGATFIGIAAISFVLTVERRRWSWAAAFAVAWGLVIALVGWFTARYNQRGEIFEWPFLAGIFAVAIAAPLFQTVRDEGAWRIPYERLHRHAWVDGVIAGASLFFTGVAFVLAFLIGALFDLIGIRLIKDLLNDSWFGWMLAGIAFGGALGLLRERDALLGTLHRLVMVVFSVMAPVLAAALTIFLISFPLTGFKDHGPFDGATPVLLALAVAAFVFTNAVIGDGRQERSPSRVLLLSALILILTILPLGLLSAWSLGQRIGQYGWTPERMWGVVAIGVTIAYGAAGWWSAIRRQLEFDEALRPVQIKLAIGLCALALFLALPIVDFGAVSANSQLARLHRGQVDAAKFDWQAMAFEFGPAGRRRLADIARTGPADQRVMASAALKSKGRYEVQEAVEAATAAPLVRQNLRVVPAGTAVPEGAMAVIERSSWCREATCVLTFVDADKAILAGSQARDGQVQSLRIGRGEDGRWNQYDDWQPYARVTPPRPNLDGKAEIRTVQRRQLFIDGKPVGDVFE